MAEGTPERVAKSDTCTGRALRGELGFAGHGAAQEGQERASTEKAELAVTAAREHNLRDVTVAIPHGALSVVTGPSGSGKSTLAFDVVFAEGQRRFLETLDALRAPVPADDAAARRRLGDGVPPSIALEQRTARAGGKSTVATVTEVAHYVRLLYAKLGVAHCPEHDEPISRQHPDELFSQVAARSRASERSSRPS